MKEHPKQPSQWILLCLLVLQGCHGGGGSAETSAAAAPPSVDPSGNGLPNDPTTNSGGGGNTEGSNSPPDALDDTFAVVQDSVGNELLVLDNDTDPDLPSDSLTVTGVGTPEHGGTITNGTTSLRYSPQPGFVGTETFTYTITDSGGASDSATVEVTVSPLPVARDDRFTVEADGVVSGDVLEDNGSGSDTLAGVPSTVTVVASPANGALTLSTDGKFEYRPNPGFSGNDQFTYLLVGPNGSVSNAATATISVVRTLAGGLPNVLYVLADDLGWGDPAAYNPQSLIPTPNINRLAAEGMIFTDAHTSTAKCAPSRYSIMTGNYQWRGLKSWGQWNLSGGSQILDGQLTMADILRRHGYETFIVGKYHLGGQFYEKNSDAFAKSLPEEDIDFARPFQFGPLAHGFDSSYVLIRGIQESPYAYFENDRLVGNADDTMIWLPGLYGDSEIVNEGIGLPNWNSSQVGPTLTQKAIDFIDQHYAENLQNGTDRPFLLFYSAEALHGPWTPPVTLLGEPVRGVTGLHAQTDMVYELDVTLGKLIETLKRHNALNNTLIVFTSDNGGIPRSDVRALGHDSVGGLSGRKGYIHEGGHRVPFIVKWGDGTAAGSQIPPASVRNQLFGVQDFVATIAALVGDSLSSDQARDSFNFLPVFLGQRGDGNPIRTDMLMEADRPLPRHFAVREGEWKLIMDGNDVPTELYDLDSDLGEADNLIDDPAQASRISQMLDLFLQLHAAERTAPPLAASSP